MSEPLYLLRVWGRDEGQVKALREPDLIERAGDGPLCYWFHTGEERHFFEAQIPVNCIVMHDRVNPGPDGDGETLDTRAYTVAVVTLKLPDGRVGMFEQPFGYGYPSHSVKSMWHKGNYSCDCNKRLFLARECGIDPHYDEDGVENPCGDTIELVSIDVFTRPLNPKSS